MTAYGISGMVRDRLILATGCVDPIIGTLNVNMRDEGGAKKSKGSKRKFGQNCVGHIEKRSKWAATGGVLRMEARKARNRARRKALSSEYRNQIRYDHRLTTRVLRAASEYANALTD